MMLAPSPAVPALHRLTSEELSSPAGEDRINASPSLLSATPPNVVYAEIGTPDALERIGCEWDELFARAGQPPQVFQTHAWCRHWCRHFLTSKGGAPTGKIQLFIVTARRAGRLVLVWPLVIERSLGVSCLTGLGHPVTQYADAVIDSAEPDAAAILSGALQHAIRRSGADLVHLRKVRADAAIHTLISESRATATAREVAPFVDLKSASDFATFEKRYPSKARKNRKRQMRRLEERGVVALEQVLGGERAAELASTAVLLKRAWLKSKGRVSPALRDPRFEAFFADVAREGVPSTGCVVTVLTTSGEPAAIEIAFECKGHRAVHVIVYAMKFMQHSPGQLLIEHSLARCYERGISTYDLLAPSDGYKSDWAGENVVAVNDWALGITARGRLYAEGYLARLRPALKNAVVSASRAFKSA
ncbi:MAG: GNAT family N-acetyltransferase [Hyphomicrobiaceae bacterium]